MMLTSVHNPKIKDLIRLREGKSHLWPDGFVVEGGREIERALKHGFELIELFFSDGRMPSHDAALLTKLRDRNDFLLTDVSAEVFARLAMREGSVGLCAVMRQKAMLLADFSPQPPALLLALEGLEKPGNLGALLRSADGSGASGVFVLDKTLNPFHHNIVRASTGALFSIPVVKTDEPGLVDFCRSRDIALIAASPDATKPYFEVDLTRPVCFVLGAEDKGLGAGWRTDAVERICLPMRGTCDSLNVSVTGAILLYEALRQRVNRVRK